MNTRWSPRLILLTVCLVGSQLPYPTPPGLGCAGQYEPDSVSLWPVMRTTSPCRAARHLWMAPSSSRRVMTAWWTTVKVVRASSMKMAPLSASTQSKRTRRKQRAMRAQRPHHRSMPSIRWPDAAPREWHYFASRRGEGEIKQLQTYHKPQPPSGTRVQHGGLPSCEDQWPPSYPQPPPSDIPMPLGAIRWESQSYAHWREL